MSKNILKEGELVPLIFDKMLKKVFGNPDNTEPIKYLIECVLKEKISDVKLLPQDIIGNNNEDKKNSVDVMATLQDRRKIIVEANTSFSKRIMIRNARFLSRVMSSELKEGYEYDDYHDHYLINLNLGGSKKYPIERYTEKADHTDIESNYYEYQSGRYIYNVNVAYFTEKCYNNDRNKLDEQEMFLGMLNCREEHDINKFMGVNKVMDKIMDQVQEFSQDEIMALAYNEEEHDKHMKRLRDLDFEDELAEKQAKFDEGIAQKQAEFDEGIAQKQAEFDKGIAQKQAEFDKGIAQKQAEFENKQKDFDNYMKDKELEIKHQKEILIKQAKKIGLSNKEIEDIINDEK